MITPEIFQVEDDADFAFFMASAAYHVNKNLNIAIATNGSDALSVLTQFANTNAKPGLILLDINLPGMSGIDLLKKIKEMRHFDAVPIIVFSTSDNPKDAKTSLEFGASAHQTKPIGYLKLVECLRTMTNEWLKN